MNSRSPLPQVVADGPLAEAVLELLADRVELLPWETLQGEPNPAIEAVYTYGHPHLGPDELDRCPRVKVISNYGVGVDHIDLPEAARRKIPVGNTPGVLNGATADMAWTLMLAAGRRLIEGDHYARSPEFTVYDPGYMLGREIHGTTLGVIGMGRIGRQIARRAAGFSMKTLYHNRRRDTEAEQELGVRYVSREELLEESDYVVLSAPLTEETRGMIDADALRRMKSTAILVNVARGPLVCSEDLAQALRKKEIYAAGLDVTDPEPLPRDHPLLKLPNIVIAPHLGSATEQTRRKMAENSVENLLCGLRDEPLPHQV